jgi:hypothetical protein
MREGWRFVFNSLENRRCLCRFSFTSQDLPHKYVLDNEHCIVDVQIVESYRK